MGKHASPLNWRRFAEHLETAVSELIEGRNLNKSWFNNLLSPLGSRKNIFGVDRRCLALFEYCMARAENPRASQFEVYIYAGFLVLAMHPPLKRLLNLKASHSLANMVLGARGRFKVKIFTHEDLQKMLEVWKLMGLDPVPVDEVFSAILEKPKFWVQIVHHNPYLLARLKAVFPQRSEFWIPEDLDLSVPYAVEHSEFLDLLEDQLANGQTLDELIKMEEQRHKPVGVERNSFLAFLVKRKYNFTCMLCLHDPPPFETGSEVQLHHVVPLGQGGLDLSENMVVLCRYHHQKTHGGKIKLEIRTVGEDSLVLACVGDKQLVLDKFGRLRNTL